MSIQIPRNFGVGGSGVLTEVNGVSLKELLNAAADDLDTIFAAFSTHQHRYDGSASTNSVTSAAVTGGTPTGTIASGGTLVGTLKPTLTESEDAV